MPQKTIWKVVLQIDKHGYLQGGAGNCSVNPEYFTTKRLKKKKKEEGGEKGKGERWGFEEVNQTKVQLFQGRTFLALGLYLWRAKEIRKYIFVYHWETRIWFHGLFLL